jgi:DNA transposition AAA+ family ATPase
MVIAVAEAVNAENAFYEQRDRSMRVTSAVPDPTALLVIDEADRLKEAGLEQVRDVFDHGGIGLVLIGMPASKSVSRAIRSSTHVLDLSMSFGHWARERFINCWSKAGCHPA